MLNTHALHTHTHNAHRKHTADAANPARDLGPRLAHWLLPIPNKGSSEWVYAWVPVVGPLLGGAAAGGLFIALERMSFPGGGPVGA